MKTLEKLVVSQQFTQVSATRTPHPLLYPRGIPPSQKFWEFSFTEPYTFWRTSGNPCDMQFCQVFAQKRCVRPRWRPGVAVFTDGPNLGLFMWGPHGWVPRGPWATPVEPGPAARSWPVLARSWPVLARFLPVFARFWLVFTRSSVPHVRTDLAVFTCCFGARRDPFSRPVTRFRPRVSRFRLPWPVLSPP